MSNIKTRINHQIRAAELRIIGPDGANMGVMSLREALEKAHELSFDLIEISPNANPPVAKIMDYGKFQYDERKKEKTAKAKSKMVETKNVQVKVGTGDHDLELKAKKASEWLEEGNILPADVISCKMTRSDGTWHSKIKRGAGKGKFGFKIGNKNPIGQYTINVSAFKEGY